jgi:dihydrofolate synthase / folylpolyglutamate synthase
VNYRDSLAWLFGTQSFGIKLGLENTQRLLEACGRPQEKLRFLHVAGTNGKGSTCVMMDSVLRAAGHRTALYTSPHLVDFRERVRVDGQMIPESSTAEGLTLLRDASEGWEQAPTFFELATVLAAWWFAREEAEFVVWETGMGGRLDATNAVMPLVSVIMPVGLDHQAWLGETITLIAAEKAGIIKPGVPVISAPQADEVRAVLEAKAVEVGVQIGFVSAPWETGPVGLAGAHQRWNAAVALAALRAAGVEVGEEAVRSGLAKVKWPGRFQRAGAALVVDGAHNPPATAVLVATWREVFGHVKARLVFGVLSDKDASALLHLLRTIADEVCLVPVAGARGTSVDELRPIAEAAGFPAVYTSTLEEVLAKERQDSTPVLVTGSLFLVGEVLALLEGAPKPVASAQ